MHSRTKVGQREVILVPKILNADTEDKCWPSFERKTWASSPAFFNCGSIAASVFLSSENNFELDITFVCELVLLTTSLPFSPSMMSSVTIDGPSSSCNSERVISPKKNGVPDSIACCFVRLDSDLKHDLHKIK